MTTLRVILDQLLSPVPGGIGRYAAELIDKAGLKGLSVGGAAVSTRHAGFVVNTGGATCRDVLELTERIKKRVLETSGVALELEVKVLR